MAINPQIPLEARQTVLDKILAGDSFTAYEITLEVRRRLGPTIEVPHGEVNPLVQAMFAGGEMIGYGRQVDQNIVVPNPPLRYFRQSGPVVAPPVRALTPVINSIVNPTINRANLPPQLQFKEPVAAMLRCYGLAARDFHLACGTPDEPFEVWLPTHADPTLRVRCYGTLWNANQLIERFSLDPAASNSADFEADSVWKAAYAYAAEFRVSLWQNGVQTTFNATLDADLRGSATKVSEQPSQEAAGIEIEIPVDFQKIGSYYLVRQATQIYRYFRVAPRVHGLPRGSSITRDRALFEGDFWRLTGGDETLLVVGDVAVTPRGSGYILSSWRGSGLEMSLDPNTFSLNSSREDLDYTPRIIEALKGLSERVKDDVAGQISASIVAAPNLWEAKILYSEVFTALGIWSDRLKTNTEGHIDWNDLPLTNNSFNWNKSGDDVIINRFEKSYRKNAVLSSSRVRIIEARKNSLIIIDDSESQKSGRWPITKLYQQQPFDQAYVLKFESEQAKAEFFAETHFETVPYLLLSQLAKGVTKTQKLAFDPTLHQVQSPSNPLIANFESLDDADFSSLKQWARETPLDTQNWPDFKRLYKRLEARLWPLQTRSRWKKNETDLPDMSLPDGREIELLGVLMARFDRGDDERRNWYWLSSRGWPSAQTLAYMARRAERMLLFLRDNEDLTAARRELLTPLVSGLLQRQKCVSLSATWPFRLALLDVAFDRVPRRVEAVWNDAALALPILKWAFEWLQKRDVSAQATPFHVRRFVEAADVDFVLRLLPQVINSEAVWPADWGLPELVRALQGEGLHRNFQNEAFRARRASVGAFFARFPNLPVNDAWLLHSLGEVTEAQSIVNVTPLVQNAARTLINSYWVLSSLSPPLQIVYNAAVVANFPAGLPLSEWQNWKGASRLAPLLAPALRQMPLSSEAAQFLWSLGEEGREALVAAIGEAKFDAALAQWVRERAEALDFQVATLLSAAQSELFFETLARAFPSGLTRDGWKQWAQFGGARPLNLPLGAEFWEFWFDLDAAQRGTYLEGGDANTFAQDFTVQSADVFERLMDAGSFEFLGDAWLDRNLSQLAPDSEFVLRLAKSENPAWSARALAHLQSRPLTLPAALRLFESELPLLQAIARPFFEMDDPQWSERTVALADSPYAPARRFALDLLTRLGERWTPALLTLLAQHDDPNVQAFVAAQWQHAPKNAQDAGAVSFDRAILNTRGRSRRAKIRVQERLSASEGAPRDLETLLAAARTGAARDRAWALQRLVHAALDGADVPALEIGGAGARVQRSQEKV